MGLIAKEKLLIFLYVVFVLGCYARGQCNCNCNYNYNNVPYYNVNHYNVMVAKDGSGNYTSVAEAIKNAPNMSDTLYHIYIRVGTYEENIYISEYKTNIRLYGDGAHHTILYSNQTNNQRQGSTIGTIEIHGDGFNAAYMSFVNGAGLTAEQATAVHNAANNTMFYAVSIEGYQATLYADKGMQWYENCEIYGTVDFIWGNAAAGFHNCMIYARFREVVTYTAQGREDPNDMTGFLFQRCNFTISPEDATKKPYMSVILGRPWRLCANVIIMGSYIDDFVAPAGWDGWGNTPTDKLTYVEYNNIGPGANADERVKWPGVRAFDNLTELIHFLLARHSWIQLPYYPY